MAKENYGDFGALGMWWYAKVSRGLSYGYAQVTPGSIGERNDLSGQDYLKDREKEPHGFVKFKFDCPFEDRSLQKVSVKVLSKTYAVT